MLEAEQQSRLGKDWAIRKGGTFIFSALGVLLASSSAVLMKDAPAGSHCTHSFRGKAPHSYSASNRVCWTSLDFVQLHTSREGSNQPSAKLISMDARWSRS